MRLPLIFSIGAALYLFRQRMRLSVPLLLGLAACCALLHGTPLYRTLLFGTEALGAVALGLAPLLSQKIFDPSADLSYGVYLYGWPIQQSLHALWPAASPWQLLPSALALTLAVAAASWYGIERPALRLKARALGRRRLHTIEPGGP